MGFDFINSIVTPLLPTGVPLAMDLSSIRAAASSAVELASCAVSSAGVAAVALSRRGKAGADALNATNQILAQPHRLLLDCLPDAVLAVDPNGRLTYVNAAAAKLVGYDAAEMIGSPLATHLLEPTDAERRGPVLLAHREGAFLAVDVSRAPLSTVDAVNGEVVILRRLDERHAQDQLARDERDVLECIAAGRTLDEIVDRVAAAVFRASQGIRLAVLIRREGVSHCFGNVPVEARRAIERLDCAAGEVSWWNVPRLIDDVLTDPGFRSVSEPFIDAGVRACWSFPLIGPTGGAALGVLLMFPRESITPEPAQFELTDRCGKLLHLAIDREQLTERLKTQSLLDPLTDLPNRMLTNDRLTQAVKRARRSRRALATLLIDLDGFKAINDSLGNQQGDLLLKQVADRLMTAVRNSDTLGRLGNDQFILIADIGDGPVSIICDRLHACFKQPFSADGTLMTLTASIGVSCFPADGEDINALLRNADTALLHTKRHSRGGYRLFEPSMNEATLERLETENQLRSALQNNEIVVHYQPQCDDTGRVVALEALARWNRNGQLISPAKFIPVAEECGLIVPIGTWILGSACRWARAWQDAGRSPLRIAVNVSVLQFVRDDFVQVVQQVLQETRLEPRWLEVEVTESLLMQNTTDAAAKLQKLRDMGVAVAIDDFGTGYSSLAYLQTLPIDILKIDRSFVKDISAGDDLTSEKTAVIRAIVSMGHNLQLKVVAEGVETETQLKFLRRVGCHQVQGYYFSPPKPGNEIGAVIDRLERAAINSAA